MSKEANDLEKENEEVIDSSNDFESTAQSSDKGKK